MKIQELKNLLKTVERENLEEAFAESYKHFNKSQKEEIDQLICGIFEGKDVKKPGKKETVDFGTLEQDITVFIRNAYDQNYFAPNRIIPKNQRPKWRFLVKGYIKELEKFTAEREEYARAVKLLTDLYHLICCACNDCLFSAEDPFRSIGWEQEDFFQLVVKKTFEAGYTRENIAGLILEASTGGVSMENEHIQQQMALLTELKTSDVKYIALEEAKKLVEERKQQLKGMTKYHSKVYSLKDNINSFCKMILLITVELAEPEEGIQYFFANCQEQDKIFILYNAFETVRWIGDDDALWMQIYEYGVGEGIQPREHWVNRYQRLKK